MFREVLVLSESQKIVNVLAFGVLIGVFGGPGGI